MKRYTKLAFIAITAAALVASTPSARAATDDIVQNISIQLTFYSQASNNVVAKIPGTHKTDRVSKVKVTSVTTADVIKWLDAYAGFTFSHNAKLVRVIRHYPQSGTNINQVISNYFGNLTTNFIVVSGGQTNVFTTYLSASNYIAVNLSGTFSLTNVIGSVDDFDDLSDDLYYFASAFSNDFSTITITTVSVLSSNIYASNSFVWTTNVFITQASSTVISNFTNIYTYFSNIFVIQVRDGSTFTDVGAFFQFEDDADSPIFGTVTTTNNDLETGTAYDVVFVGFGNPNHGLKKWFFSSPPAPTNPPSFSVQGFATVTLAHSTKTSSSSTNIYDTDTQIAITDVSGTGTTSNGVPAVVKGSITIGSPPNGTVKGE